MKTIIAGSRTINDPSLVEEAVRKSGFKITEVISGGARGIDRLAEAWARRSNLPVRCFPAEWNRYGKQAGHLRNEQMADDAEGLIAVWDGRSPGTGQMIKVAKKKGLKVFVLSPKGDSLQKSVSRRVVYDRTFFPDSGEVEARALIVDDSDDDHLAFRLGITERSFGGNETVTLRGKIEEKCAGFPDAVRRVLREDLYRQAKGELEREIRIATDPHYDRPEREIY